MNHKFLLMGLGNILLGDEGAGVRSVEALAEKFEFSEDLRMLDGGTLGLDLLPYLEGKEKILFVDAVDFREKPGEVSVWEGEEIPSFLGPALSFHQIGLRDILFASKLMGMNPAEVVLVGIQPAEIETGLTLSDPLQKNFAALLQAVLTRLSAWGIRIKEKNAKGKACVSGRTV
jgi:hydrogenase maturation protease